MRAEARDDDESGAWSPERTGDGTWTLRHRDLDEACHSRFGAWTESWERYALPCQLRDRARAGAPRLRVLDVGTGLGWNVAAALVAVEGTATRLEVTTLELEPEVIRRGIELLRGLEARGADVTGADAEKLEPKAELPGARVPDAELAAGGPGVAWGHALDALERCIAEPDRAQRGADAALGVRGNVAPQHRLRLHLGDARETVLRVAEAPSFDAVFLDPFSPARAPELWSAAFLAQVARRMAPGSWLSTYSAAVGVRRNLMRAGLCVGVGPRVGAKAEGTLASPDREPPPLPERLAAKLWRQLQRRSEGN